MVTNEKLGDFGPLHRGVQWKKPVHFTVEANAFDHRRPIRLQ